MAGRVNGDAERVVVVGAAEVGGIDERRVDDEGIARFVGADLESVGGQAQKLEPPGDGDALAVDVLIDGRRALFELAEGRPDHKGAVLGDAESLDPPVRHPDFGGIASGPDDELLLKMAAVAVEPEVDPVPDVPIDDLAPAADPGPPAGRIVAEVVVVSARKELARLDRRAVIGAEEVLTENQSSLRKARQMRSPLRECYGRCARLRRHPQEIEDYALVRQPEGLAPRSQVELRALVDLPQVFDERVR